MKTLWKNGTHELVIQDSNNYTYGKPVENVSKEGKKTTTMHNAKFFTNLDAALKHICRVTANEECKPFLRSWLDEYRKCAKMFATELGES